MSESGSDIPEIIDIRDDLDRAEAAAARELSEETETVRDRLGDFPERSAGDREGIVDSVDNELLRLEEQAESDDASEYLQAARNRLQLFRDALGDADGDLVVVTTRLESDSHNSGGTDVTSFQGEQVRLELTVANVGGPAAGRPTVAFYDDENAEIETFSADPVEFDDGGAAHGRPRRERSHRRRPVRGRRRGRNR
jgi:hypothetical protein